MTAATDFLHGGCCCVSSHCHGIPQRGACLWNGPVDSESDLDFLKEIDFRASQVTLPYWRILLQRREVTGLSADAYLGYDLLATSGSEEEYTNSPMRLSYRMEQCSPNNLGTDPASLSDWQNCYHEYISRFTGKVRSTAFSECPGYYVWVWLEVIRCPSPGGPLPQHGDFSEPILSPVSGNSPKVYRSAIHQMFTRPSRCGRGPCENLDEDALSITPLDELLAHIQRVGPMKSDCARIRMEYRTGGGSPQCCDPALWHLTDQDYGIIPTDTGIFRDLQVCFNNRSIQEIREIKTDRLFQNWPIISSLSEPWVVGSRTYLPIAGNFRRCESAEIDYDHFTANAQTFPLYSGYRLSNPVLFTPAAITAEEYSNGVGAGTRYIVNAPVVQMDIEFVPHLEIPYLESAFGGQETPVLDGRFSFVDDPNVNIWDGVGGSEEDIIVVRSSVQIDEALGQVYSGGIHLKDEIAKLQLSPSDLSTIQRKRKIDCTIGFRGRYSWDNGYVHFAGYYHGDEDYPMYESVDGWEYDSADYPVATEALSQAQARVEQINGGVLSACARLTGRSATELGTSTWTDPTDQPEIPNWGGFASCVACSDDPVEVAENVWVYGGGNTPCTVSLAGFFKHDTVANP